MIFEHKVGETMHVLLEERDVALIEEFHYQMDETGIEGSAPKVRVRINDRFDVGFATVGDGDEVNVFLPKLPKDEEVAKIPNENIMDVVDAGKGGKNHLFGKTGEIAVSLALQDQETTAESE